MEINYTVIYTKKIIFGMRFNSIRTKFTYYFVSLLLLAATIYLLINFVTNPIRFEYFIGPYLFLVLAVYVSVVGPVLSVFRIMKETGDGKVEYTLNDYGVLSKTSVSEGKQNWSTIKGISQTKEYLMLNLAGSSYYPVPNEVLTEEKIAWIKGKVGR